MSDKRFTAAASGIATLSGPSKPWLVAIDNRKRATIALIMDEPATIWARA